MDITGSVMLTYSWFKLINKSLFIMCVVTCIQISNTDVSDRERQVL